MQFKTESAALVEGLRVIKRLAPPTNGTVTLVSDGRKVQMRSQGEINQCELIIPGQVKNEGEFAITIESFEQAIRGRSDLRLIYKNMVLTVKSTNYVAELPTSEAVEMETATLEKAKKIKIDGEQAAWLKTAVAAATLKATTLVSMFMPIGVRLTKKGAFVSCFDATHMSWISSKEISGDAEFTVPVDLLAGVLDAFGKQSFVLRVSSDAIEVSNKLCRVRLNLPEIDEQSGPTLPMVIDKAKEIAKAKGSNLVLSKDEVLAFLDNSRAVALKERGSINLVSDKKTIDLSVTTVNGAVRAQLQSKAPKLKFNVDYEYFDEMVRKSADQLELKACGAFLVCTSSKATTVVSFNKVD